MNKFAFFGGKGGVGKTTCSSAYAYKQSEKGFKTLIVSTDPAHSLSDIFEIKIGPEIVEIGKNLYALEIDPELESKKYVDGIKGNMESTLSPIIMQEVQRQLDAATLSPGSEESAIFDKFVEIINEHGKEFDKVVFDTAPTGHTLRLLSLPELLGAWLERIIEKRKKALSYLQMSSMDDKKKREELMNDPILNILQRRKDNLEKARKVLIDDRMISFIYVLNAEKLPIDETKKAVEILEKYGIPVEALIVNRILPESLDSFWKSRKELEGEYLRLIDSIFKEKEIIKLPLMESDIKADNIKEVSGFFN